jgi:hypothetical protein
MVGQTTRWLNPPQASERRWCRVKNLLNQQLNDKSTIGSGMTEQKESTIEAAGRT